MIIATAQHLPNQWCCCEFPVEAGDMRHDMAKVIVERPRPGSNRHVARRFRPIDPKTIALSDDEAAALPGRIGHKRAAAIAGDTKSLNENLSPLRRFLEQQVGRPWDAVWAELSAHIRPDNTVQQHVRDHVQDCVAVRTVVRNERIFIASGFRGGLKSLADCCWPKLYVDPRTGLLCRNPTLQTTRTRRRRLDAEAAVRLAGRLRVIAPDRQLHLLSDGNWWEVMKASIPRTVVELPSGRRQLVDQLVVDLDGDVPLYRVLRFNPFYRSDGVQVSTHDSGSPFSRLDHRTL